MADLFDIVVARKLSGGGGGGGSTVEALSVTQNGTYTAPSGKAYSPVSVNVSGGSSDFSTAEVTITTTGESGVSPALILCAITEVDGYTGIDTFITDGGGETFTVPLYKGACSWGFFYPDGAPPATVVVTGDIAYDDEEAIVTITGDGTITIS